MRYGVPENEQILAEIRSGYVEPTFTPPNTKAFAHPPAALRRAPPHILNVSPGQPVELRVVKRLDEDYVASPKARQAKVFSGQGHRLGSPIPGDITPGASASSSGSGMPGGFPTGTAGGSSLPTQRAVESISTRFEVDQSKPTTSVQIRLADGTR